MSEPNDGSTTGSEGAPAPIQPNADLLPKGPYEVQDAAGAPAVPDAPAAEAPVAPDAPVTTEAPEPAPAEVAPATPATGWVAPPATGGRSKGCYCLVAIGAIVLLALPVIVIALIFLGSQVQNILGGTMLFGTGGTGCAVTGQATTFPASASIHTVAFLERDVVAGESITIAVTYPNGTTESGAEVMEEGGRCIFDSVDPGLTPGKYVIEYRAGTTVLSRGELTITP